MDAGINGAHSIRPAIAGVVLIVSVLLLSMVNHAHADSASVQAEAPRAEVVLEAGEIDSSTVEVGTLSVVIYEREERQSLSGTQALLDTARGYIKAVNQRRLIVGLEPDGWSKWIALERIKTLTLAGSLTQRSADRDSTQVASGRAVRWLGETPDTLSGRTQRRDAKGTGKRIAKKLVGGTSAGLAGGIAGSWWGPFWMTVVGPLLY